MEMCRSLFLTVSLLLTALCAKAAEVVITGKSTDFSGYELYVSAYHDVVSAELNRLADVSIADDGRFNLRFELDSPKRIRMDIAAWTAEIYAVPGRTYEVVLQRPTAPMPRTFDGNPLEVVFAGLPENDPNALMEKFRMRYNALFGKLELAVELSVHRGTSVVEQANATNGDSLAVIPSVEESFAQFSGEVIGWMRGTREPFTRDLLNSALGRVDLALGARHSYIDSVYGPPGIPNLHNPEAVQLFAELHELVLANDPLAQTAFLKGLSTADGELLSVTLQKFTEFADVDRRWLFTVMQCKALATNDRELRKGVLQLLSAVPGEVNPELVGAASKLRQGLVRGTTEASPFLPNLTLVDQRGDRLTLSELEGKIVYISVVAMGSASCEREMLSLEPVWRKFQRQVEFITLVLDADDASFKNYIAKHPAREWSIVNGGSNPELKHALRLRTIPSFYLIGPDGKLISNVTRSPSEGIHDTLVQLLR